jgi:phenylpyruvate tautomerase PptA (4-oxalocrotonate tautomerase family)
MPFAQIYLIEGRTDEEQKKVLSLRRSALRIS